MRGGQTSRAVERVTRSGARYINFVFCQQHLRRQSPPSFFMNLRLLFFFTRSVLSQQVGLSMNA